jgi:hypothetical protein
MHDYTNTPSIAISDIKRDGGEGENEDFVLARQASDLDTIKDVVFYDVASGQIARMDMEGDDGEINTGHVLLLNLCQFDRSPENLAYVDAKAAESPNEAMSEEEYQEVMMGLRVVKHVTVALSLRDVSNLLHVLHEFGDNLAARIVKDEDPLTLLAELMDRVAADAEGSEEGFSVMEVPGSLLDAFANAGIVNPSDEVTGDPDGADPAEQ